MISILLDLILWNEKDKAEVQLSKKYQSVLCFSSLNPATKFDQLWGEVEQNWKTQTSNSEFILFFFSFYFVPLLGLRGIL